MISGVHLLLYSRDPEADRAFLRDILELRCVDAGEGWFIFGLPPAEMGVHPGDGHFVERHAGHELLGSVAYLMCDNLHETIATLKTRGVATTAIESAGWGDVTTLRLPSGGSLGLYQPRHKTALHLSGQ
jgi:catechol 2,3-dioxygenase-like lactoylglutathione lyase family enzyme